MEKINFVKKSELLSAFFIIISCSKKDITNIMFYKPQEGNIDKGWISNLLRSESKRIADSVKICGEDDCEYCYIRGHVVSLDHHVYTFGSYGFDGNCYRVPSQLYDIDLIARMTDLEDLPTQKLPKTITKAKSRALMHKKRRNNA